MEAAELPAGDPGSLMGRSLSAHALEFQPTSTPMASKSGSPVKPVKTRDVFVNLDYVPFTPSQGICTPSPSNLAVACGVRRAGSDRSSAGSGLTSLSPAGEHGLGPFLVPSSMYPIYPMQYSPGGAHPRYAGPLTPTHAAWSPGAVPAAGYYAGSPGPAAFVGSPATVAATPGRAIFAQYLAQEGYASDKSNSPQGGGSEGSSPGQKMEKRAACPGAHEAAVAWCAEKGVHSEPPQAALELASLALAYGITLDIAAEVANTGTSSGNNSSGANSSSSSPSKPAAKSTSGGSQQGDAGVRLNARQRRTLRRALDRASAALETMQQQEQSGADAPSEGGFLFKTPVKGVNFKVDSQTGVHTTPVNINAVSGAAVMAGMGLGQAPPMMWQGAAPMQMQMPMGVGYHDTSGVAGPQMFGHMPHPNHVHMVPQGAVPFQMGPAALSPPPAMGHGMHGPGIHPGFPMYHQQVMPMQHVGQGSGRSRHGVSRFAPARAVAQ